MLHTHACGAGLDGIGGGFRAETTDRDDRRQPWFEGSVISALPSLPDAVKTLRRAAPRACSW
ncbi:MAG: hypothetical protein JO202_02910 [Ktedonobacteraceae bacterium]|nr:hypothetical protein [Ktedonobacteraceae bacterium]